MCGILGEVGIELLVKDVFLHLLQLSYKRGPDQRGYWTDEHNCQFGFNRLSILDLTEHGLQPMISPSGRYVVVFNGEIYNYKRLQGKFGIRDDELRSTSDTEILVQLLEKLPLSRLASELNGMFAIAVFDRQAKRIHLLRDFAGIKPLFYGLSRNGIVFASQFNQIHKHPWFVNAELRPDTVKDYFGLGYMSSPGTVFKDIFQLQPGEILTWDLSYGGITQRKFFNKWTYSNTLLDNSLEAMLKFRKVFGDAVTRQLNADVPVAAFLSGGIDSPLVAAFASQSSPGIRTFTVGLEDKELDESVAALRIAEYLKLDNVLERYTENELRFYLDHHFEAITEPFGDYSSLPTYFITRKAKQFATVMLSGDGGDELFWGYPRFITQLKGTTFFRYPLFVRIPFVKVARKLGCKLSYAFDTLEEFADWTLNFQIQFFNQDINRLVPGTEFSSEIKGLYRFEGNLSDDTAVLRWLKWNEFYGHLQRVLRKVDLTSMGNSLEVRVPFLDKEVMLFSNTLIPKLGVEYNEPKLLLKKALAKSVPSDMILTAKKGFGLPINRFLRGPLKQDLLSNCIDGEYFGKEIIDTSFVRNYILGFLSEKHHNGWGVWHLFAWQKWAAMHVKN
ncbi:MAG: asparagine synthase (glutamine-hydrolyzing) [Cyclobacteriaceae bacterium]|nr:asparagine synthase (glutamine-hydrolyzing) [Cyclobacteriaceae bacterium]